jgi:hypothetical protein
VDNSVDGAAGTGSAARWATRASPLGQKLVIQIFIIYINDMRYITG